METDKLARAVSIGLLCGGLGAVSCSSEGAPRADVTPSVGVMSSSPEATPASPTASPEATSVVVAMCVADNADAWTRVPLGLNTEKIAQELDVAPDDVANGLAGQATCDTAVNLDRIGEGLRVSVGGVEVDKCLVIGGDTPGGQTKNVGVVCTAPKTTDA